MKFYAIGTKQEVQVVDGEKTKVAKSFVINLDSTVRVLAEQEASFYARKHKLTVEGVYVAKNFRQTAALPMTKAFKERKKERSGLRIAK